MDKNDSLITIADVDYISNLAHLDFAADEKEDIANKLGAILNYMQQLGSIDTDGVIPTTHVLPITNVFREDIIGETLDREEALKLAPEHEGPYYKVPKIF